MNEINRVLRQAAWRVAFSDFLRGLIVALLSALTLAIIARLTQQALGATWPWTVIGWYALGVCVAAGLFYAVIARPKPLEVARRVDEGANLRESLSTALCVAPSNDAWSRVTVESASRVARGVRVSQAVPVRAPRFWPAVLPLIVAMVLVFALVPRLDLFGTHAAKVAEATKQAQILQAKTEVVDAQKKIEEMVKDLDLGKDKTEAIASEKPEAKDPEAIRKSAIKELSKLSDRLQQLRTGEKAQKLDALTKNLKQLKAPGAETAELTKALATGDFKQAKQELEKLAQAAASSSSMSEQEKKEAAKQLAEVAKQLEKLAENKKDLEKKLAEAGLDKALAKDPAALQKALEKAGNLSDQQKQQLAEMAQASQQSSESAKGLSEALSKMSESMKSGDQAGTEKGAEGGMKQLSELEQISQEMQSADAAMNEAKNQMAQMGGKCDNPGEGEGQGNSTQAQPWSDRFSEGKGKAGGIRSGGGGIGEGGQGQTAKADFSTEKRKSIGAQGKGPIVGSRLVQGESIKGESKAEFVKVVADADQTATEAIENNTIPREFHDAVKSYFGRLKDKATEKAGAGQPAAPSADLPPAQPAAEPASGKK